MRRSARSSTSDDPRRKPGRAGAQAQRHTCAVSYQATLQSWHDFYMVAGTASASLVGLLFVGLSLHLRAVVSRPDVRGLARVTFTSFGLALLVSLFMVIPENHPDATAVELVISGVVAIGLVAPSIIAGLRTHGRSTLDFRRMIWRFGLSTFGYVIVIVAGALFAGGNAGAGLSWLVGATTALLLLSLRNSWDLLVSVGAATLQA